MASTQTLTDRDAIREWANVRGATPARLRGGPRTNLTFDFHQVGQGAVQDLPWDRWFETFDRFGLALLVDANTREASNRFELVSRSQARAATGAVKRQRHGGGSHQPVAGRARTLSEKSASPSSRRPTSLRTLVRAQRRRPEVPAPTGTPGPVRRAKARVLPKPARRPRRPKRR